MRSVASPSVRRLLDDVGVEGVVAGDADGVAGQRVRVPPGRMAAGEAEIAQRGEEDLAVGCRHQIVEDGIDGGADVEQDVGEHVEIVVEVVQVIGPLRDVAKHEAASVIGQPADHKGYHHGSENKDSVAKRLCTVGLHGDIQHGGISPDDADTVVLLRLTEHPQ